MSAPITPRPRVPCAPVRARTPSMSRPVVDTHVVHPAGYSFNRHDAWTHMHDWGCFNWNWVHKMQRRQDPEEKDKYFM